MQRAKFGDEGGRAGLVASSVQFPVPSLPPFLLISVLSSPEIGTGLSLLPRTIIALRTYGGFCCMHLQFSLSNPLPRKKGTTERMNEQHLQKDHPSLEDTVQLQDALEQSPIKR